MCILCCTRVSVMTTRKVYLSGSLHGFFHVVPKEVAHNIGRRQKQSSCRTKQDGSVISSLSVCSSRSCCLCSPHYMPESRRSVASTFSTLQFFSSLMSCTVSLIWALIAFLLWHIFEQHGSNYCCVSSSCYLPPPIKPLEKVPASYAKNGDTPERRCPRHVRTRRCTDHRRHGG